MPQFGPSAEDSDDRGASTSRLINCYRQPVAGKGRTQFILKAVPGTELFTDMGVAFFNGATSFQNNIYAAYNGMLYRVGGAALGSILPGDTTFASNNGILCIAAGGLYYTLDGSTLTQQAPDPFTAVGSVDFGDQYSLITEKDGRRVAWSDLADGTTFDSLSFRTSEASDEDVIRGVYLNGRWIIFKASSREVLYNTGQAGADAWDRVAGGIRSTGLKAFNLLTKTDEALFWIGGDNICRITLDGVQDRKFSYPPVDTAIKQGQPTECFYYETEGQKFCCVRFEDRPTWALDLATGEWHERAEGDDHDPWQARGTVRLGEDWYILTNSGQVRKLVQNNREALAITRLGAYSEGFDEGFAIDPPVDLGAYSLGYSDAYDNEGEEAEADFRPLRRTAISETFYADDCASLDKLVIFARTGFSDLGRDAFMWIRISRDGGHTWTREKWRSLGSIGAYRQKAVWRALGHFEQLTIEANISEPAEIPLWADYNLKAG